MSLGALVQRVEQPDIAVAAQAEDVRHLLAHEIVDDDLAAVEDVARGHRGARRAQPATTRIGLPSRKPRMSSTMPVKYCT